MEPRNLFLFPLPLSPEAYFTVVRHEAAYTPLLLDWLRARGFLQQATIAHGLLPFIVGGGIATVVFLLCEQQPHAVRFWGLTMRNGWMLPSCDVRLSEDQQAALVAYITTEPHLQQEREAAYNPFLDDDVIP